MMEHLALDERNRLAYLHHPPARADGVTLVFVNALTGSTDHWETIVAPALREAGFGTLSYNFRGQVGSGFSPDTALSPDLIVSDLLTLLAELTPSRPVLVGLSIGGLFAAQAVMRGAKVEALVLLNTLREIGPRIAWINDALPQLVRHGGVGMFMDALLPLLVNPDFAQQARGNALTGGYEPMADDHGHMNLMRHSVAADWDFDWAALDLPVLNITGLHDRVFLDQQVVDRLYGTLSNARREDWEDAGHLLPLERPEKLAASLTKFAREIETGTW